MGRYQLMKGLEGNIQELGLYSEGDGELLKGLDQEGDVIRLAVQIMVRRKTKPEIEQQQWVLRKEIRVISRITVSMW